MARKLICSTRATMKTKPTRPNQKAAEAHERLKRLNEGLELRRRQNRTAIEKRTKKPHTIRSAATFGLS